MPDATVFFLKNRKQANGWMNVKLYGNTQPGITGRFNFDYEIVINSPILV